MLYLIAACENSGSLSVISYIKVILQVIIIVVPSILLVMSAWNLFKIITNPNAESKEEVHKIIGRMLAIVTIYFIPLFVNLLASNLANAGIGVASTYSTCMEEANETTIAYYKAKEDADAALEEQSRKAEADKADKERKSIEEVREKARKENEKKAEEERKKQEEERRRRQQQNQQGNNNSSSSWNGTLIDGNAQSWKDVVWDPNDVTKISNLTAAQLKAVLNAKGGNATNFIPLVEAYITNEHTNQINALFFLSLHAIESGWVTSSVSRACNNLGGWKDFSNPSYVCARAPANESSTPYKYFQSKGDFVMNVGSSMHTNYLTPGGSHYNGPSVSGIIHDYNCGSQSEINSIISIANDLFNYVKQVV